jgi:general transcription factor 3C polypeptide 3 (transcription factor C subunit 4)
MHQEQQRSYTESNQSMEEVRMYQEVLYNLGRGFHDVRLYHLAAAQYEKALQLAREHPALARPPLPNSHQQQQQQQEEEERVGLNVTREAAHNLVLIYRRSGASDLALDIMQSFLML